MLCQTIDQLLPLLDLMRQPAFCLRSDGTVVANRAARHLAPAHGDSFPLWLGDGAASFECWDRSGCLELPICAASRDYSVTIQPAQDGLLCLMHELFPENHGTSAMAVASQVLRQPLTDLSGQVQHLADRTDDPDILEKTAAMQRQLYRISRISANLTDLELLRQGQYPLRMKRLDAAGLLVALLEEVAELARESSHPLNWTVPTQNAVLQGDESLISRAILNLISNALKFSPAGTPVSVQSSATQDRLLIQVENVCDEDAAVLLRGAFDRLHQRDLLPDPRWGVGLGLPLAQTIARIHGGMVALEFRDNHVTVTMTFSRRRSTEPPTLKAPIFAYDGGMRQTLLELADCLPNQIYHRDAL